MSTSGSIDFSMTASQIIRDAMGICGCIEADESPTSSEYELGLRSLNMMVKTWMAEGIHLWTTEEFTLFCQKGQAKYVSTTWDATKDYLTTSLDADASTGDYIISLATDETLTVGDNIGIELEDGSMQWTTVSDFLDHTITDSLSGDAKSGATVHIYTTAANRPLKIISARRKDTANQDTPIMVYSRDEYLRLPNKTTEGKVTQIYYDPQRSVGNLYLWPTPDNSEDRIEITAQRAIEDFDLVTNEPDFPQEWYETLVYGLADRLCIPYSVPLGKWQMIVSRYQELKQILMAWDNEPSSVFIGPEMYL